MFLKYKANMKQVNKYGQNIFHCCSKNEKADILRLIGNKFPSNKIQNTWNQNEFLFFSLFFLKKMNCQYI